MRGIMKNCLIIIILFFSFLMSFNFASANDNLNKYIFSNPYEIELIENLITEINNIEPNKISDFILGFNYDLKNRKDKMYSNCIIRLLVSNLCKKNLFYTMTDPKTSKFIEENLSNEIYDDENVWKKIKTWILLRPGLMELEKKRSIKDQEKEYEKYFMQRNELITKIIKNKNEYAPLLTYLSLLDGAALDYEERPNDFIKCEEKLKHLIKDYPDSEFAQYSAQQLASFYEVKGDPPKAIAELEKIINNSPNFYSGGGDFHSSIAGKLLTLYRDNGNKEKVKHYMKKINPIVKNYNEIISVCNQYLNAKEENK